MVVINGPPVLPAVVLPGWFQDGQISSTKNLTVMFTHHRQQQHLPYRYRIKSYSVSVSFTSCRPVSLGDASFSLFSHHSVPLRLTTTTFRFSSQIASQHSVPFHLVPSPTQTQQRNNFTSKQPLHYVTPSVSRITTTTQQQQQQQQSSDSNSNSANS